jgi:hypothetical protein
MLGSIELLNYMESRIPDGQGEDWGAIVERDDPGQGRDGREGVRA